MKTLSCLILCLLFPALFFAQDVVVKTNGEKLFCRIVSIDSSSISFQSKDTSKKEISVIQKTNLLAWKKVHEKPVFLFIPDTLIKPNGGLLICKIVSINPSTVTYLQMDSTLKVQKSTLAKNFSVIHYGNGSQQVVDPNNDYVDSQFSSNLDYYKMGEEDAKTYYQCPGAVGGEVLSGLGTYAFGIGIFTDALIYAIPPQQLNNPLNSNNRFLKTNKDYYEGYMAAAKKKEHAKEKNAYWGSLAAPIIIVVALFMEG